MRICILFGLVVLIISITAARAQNTDPPPRIDVPQSPTPPRIDASEQDPAWTSAALISSLTVSLRTGGEKLSPLPTQVRLLWDADWLYIRFTCTAGEIYSPFTHHGDKLYQGDVVEVFIDPKGDGRHWLEVEVSPNNVTMEVQTMLTAEPKWDANRILTREIISRDLWANLDYTLAGMRTAASIRRDQDKVIGWTVDLALPARVLMRRLGADRFSPGALRANFMRYAYPAPAKEGDKRSLIAMNWAPVMYGQPHISPAAMGYVTLVRRPPDHDAKTPPDTKETSR
ncbi:MAG TPA: carbohydrate-binding family 9-like protein [Tepidisphaeraceae bacterium]|jgi:hypothetical protein|nr:carbohydrate-binding family 9-like protein [Tepidisphaeraceae bacterium]